MKTKELQCIGCETPGDALLVLPKLHIDKKTLHKHLSAAPLERPILMGAQVVSFCGLDADNNKTKSPFPRSIELELDFEDARGIHTRVFGMKIAEAKELEGQDVVFECSIFVSKKGNRYIKGFLLSEQTGRIEPQYVGVSGQISGTKIHAAIELAYAQPDAIQDAVEKLRANDAVVRFIEDAGMSPEQMIRNLHAPETLEAADKALKLARDSVVHEIKTMAVSCDGEPEAASYNIDSHLIELVGSQPEKLSTDQRRALNAIRLEVNQRKGIASSSFVSPRWVSST